jgi:hypothetical protein
MSMTEEMKRIISATAEDAAERAVSKTLTMFGFDSANPLEVQKDMASLRTHRLTQETPEYKADVAWVRGTRSLAGTIKSVALPIIITALTTGALVTVIPQARAWVFGS